MTQANYDKIKTEMSLSEVESILGGGKEQASSAGAFGGVSMDAKSVVWQDGKNRCHHVRQW